MEKVIEIMIDSASRPNLLKQTLPVIIDNLKFSGKLVWMFHEAVLIKEKSDENLEYIKSLGIFDVIKCNTSPSGEGISIKNILEVTKSKYFIHWEDDYIPLRNIDLDEMYEIMENSGINQLIFHRRDTMHEVAGWIKGEYTINGKVFTTSPHWRYIPSLWRLSYIKPIWLKCNMTGPNSHWTINDELQKDMQVIKTHEMVSKTMKTFYYGPIGEPAFCKHIGYGYSNRGKL
jgi:hypothetical protein